jgi:hypothetical protein
MHNQLNDQLSTSIIPQPRFAAPFIAQKHSRLDGSSNWEGKLWNKWQKLKSKQLIRIFRLCNRKASTALLPRSRRRLFT